MTIIDKLTSLRADRRRREAMREKFTWELYPPDEAPRPSRPKAGQGLVIQTNKHKSKQLYMLSFNFDSGCATTARDKWKKKNNPCMQGNIHWKKCGVCVGKAEIAKQTSNALQCMVWHCMMVTVVVLTAWQDPSTRHERQHQDEQRGKTNQ